MPSLLAPAPLLLVLVPLAAQRDPAAPEADPVALVARAEKSCAGDGKEDGVLLCWQAIAKIQALPEHPVRGAAALTAQFLLQKHDPLAAERDKTRAQVAKAQVELAQLYRAKKWFDVAATQLDVADRYDRTAGTKERALLAAARPKTRPDEAPAAPAAPAASLLVRANTSRVSGTWRESPDQLECAAHAEKDGVFEWLTNQSHEDAEISVEYKDVAGKGDETAAIEFGVRDGAPSYMTTATHFAKEGYHVLALFEDTGNDYRALASVTLQPPATADGFHRLAVQVSGKTVRVRLDAETPVEVTLAAPARGKAGIAAGLGNRAAPAVVFRNLRIGPLPADAPSDDDLRAAAQQKTQNAIVAAVDRAKDLVAKKQPEAASAVLRSARLDVGRLAPGMLRDNLGNTIDVMIEKADPLAGKRKKVAADCAAALLALADRYAAAGTVRLAQVVVDEAAGFDPDGLQARVAAAQQAVDAWIAAQALARAAELAPPADDGSKLREWFAEGRRLDTRLRDWAVDGPVVRAPDLQTGEFTVFKPKNGVPPLTKASIHVHLPILGCSAGWCFDVAGPMDFSVALLVRQSSGFLLSAYRYVGGAWHNVGSKSVPVEPWRLGGWFPMAIEATATGITVRCGDVEIAIDRKKLGTANGRVGLWADNQGKAAATVEFRALRIDS